MTSLGFISDVHANVAALRAVLADLQKREVERIYCLGDLVGYGPDPNGVIDLVRSAAIPTIRGNYDDGIGFERGHCGCFYPDAEAKRIGELSYRFTVETVTPERKEYLRGLPAEMRVESGGRSLHLVHGSPRKINEYLLPDRDSRTYVRLSDSEALSKVDILVFGHTHTGWHRTYGSVLFVNVGSAGKPGGGDPRAACCILRIEPGRDPEPAEIRVEYDVEETASAVVAAGLPVELAAVLRQGSSR